MRISRPSPSIAISLAALVVATSGSAYAAGLGRNTVGTTQLKNGSVTTLKLAKGSVGPAAVRDNSLTGGDIKEGTLDTVPNAAKLGGKLATSYELAGGTVRIAPFTLTTGGTRVMATVGSLTLTARCRTNVGGNDIADVLAETTESNAVLDAKDTVTLLSAATPEANREWMTTAAPANDRAVSNGVGYIAAPSGRSIGGRLWAGVNLLGTPNSCAFGGFVVLT